MSDAAYMDAVRRGDMKTAQRMVDAAANAAGYTIESFHGTNGDLFTVFDPSMGGKKTGAESAALGIFSTNNANVAQQYAENYGVGGALDLAFGSGPIAEARDEALKTREGVRLMRELEEAKENVKRANDIVGKKAEEAVTEQIEAVSTLRELIAKYDKNAAKDLVNRLVQMHWVNEELYNDKIIVDAQKLQNEAEERLSDYVAPFITAKIPNKRILQLRLKIKNPKIYDAGHKTPAQFSLSDKIRDAMDEGYDGVIFNNIIDPVESATHYVVFNSEQIKLASAVTKDDAGRVIPLSQRFDDQSKDIRNPYTRPDLRERLKRKIMAGDKGGLPGEWSARKSQLLAAEYEKAGGGYTGGRSKAQRSLSKWTKQDWRTKSGKPSLETGERYLPAAAIRALSSAEYAATTRAKRKATRQFSRQPRRIAMKTKEFRNPVAYPKEEITYAALSPTPANKDIAAGKAFLETPAFKKWFGDSKVRDLAKRPMVVYHGTCASGFTEFDPTKTREMGFHFGTPPQAKDFLKGCGTYRGSKPGIYPVYLSIQNPIFTPDVYSEEPTYFIEWLEKTNHIHEWFPDENDSYYRSLNKLRGELAEAKSAGENQMKKRTQKAIWGLLRKIVTRKGYDGVRYKNENEGNTDDPSNIAWIAFSPGQIKSATENILTFDRRDPDIRNPMDPSSAFTQIAGTKGTYAEAAKMIGGKVIDYGAGYGLGTDVMRDAGLSVDSYEPFPEKWKGKRPPTFTSSEKIPDARYDSLVSFSVVNVVKPDERKKIFRDVARILRPGGVALITGRTPDDVEKAKTKVPHLEKGGYMIDQGVRRRYQKGFTQSELEQYAREVLGPGFKVERNAALNGASIKVTKVGKAKSNPLLYPPDQVRAYETEVQSRLGFPNQTQLGADLELQRHRQWNTDEFRKWFGDSVVTKPNGAPLLVYHGTCRAGFTKFDPTKTREMGFHFGTWAQAKDFVGGCEKSEIPGVGPGVYPVYLSIQRALETPDLYSSVPISFIRWIEETNPVHKWFTGKDDPYFKKLKYLQNQASMAVYKFSGGEASELSKFLKMSNKKTWNHLKAIIMRKGYDGIRYKNMSEGNAADPNNIAWIAFSPAQVKSATDNRGTFNRRDAALDNPISSMVRSKLSRIIEPGDRILCYDRAQGEDLYRLWDMIHTATPLTKDALVEIEGMLDDDGVLVIESGEEPPGLRDHFRKVIKYSGMLLVQGPMNPEEARINTEKLRRDLE